MDRIAVGIDPGLSFGAISALDVDTGDVVEIVQTRFPSTLTFSARLGLLRELCILSLQRLQPETVAVERPHVHWQTESSVVFIASYGVIVEACMAATGMDPVYVSPKTVKFLATGSGKASKKDMCAAAKTRWPHIRFEDDHCVDATWIAEYARDRLVKTA